MTGADRSNQLLDVAEELFVSQGYGPTSMDDIARAAGVTRPIVYGHHGSKEGVYLACVERARHVLVDDYVAAIADLDDPVDVLRAAAEAWFGTVERDPKRWLLLFGGAAVPLSGDLGARMAEVSSQNLEFYVSTLAQWTRPDVSGDQLAAFAAMVAGVGDRLAHFWIANPQLSRTRIVEMYVEFSVGGLRPVLRDDVAPTARAPR